MNITCTDNIPLNSTSTIDVHNQLRTIISYVYMIAYPIILIVGFIGNLLSSILFSTTDLCQTSCAIYFLLLSISDSIALLGGLHHCLVIGFHIIIASPIYCRVRHFLLYVFMDLASWMVVAISVDRFYKVKYPLRARIYCTRKLTLIISFTITGILILKNIHLSTPFIGNSSSKNSDDKCDANPDYPKYVFFFSNIWPWIDVTIFALLPFLIILLCSSYIIYNQRKRRLKFGTRTLDRSLTKFLLISAICFVICNFPLSISMVLYPYLSGENNKTEAQYATASFLLDLFRLPSYASLALNFYFYYYSSSIFKRKAVILFKRIRRMSIKSSDEPIQTIQIQSRNSGISTKT